MHKICILITVLISITALTAADITPMAEMLKKQQSLAKERGELYKTREEARKAENKKAADKANEAIKTINTKMKENGKAMESLYSTVLPITQKPFDSYEWFMSSSGPNISCWFRNKDRQQVGYVAVQYNPSGKLRAPEKDYNQNVSGFKVKAYKDKWAWVMLNPAYEVTVTFNSERALSDEGLFDLIKAVDLKSLGAMAKAGGVPEVPVASKPVVKSTKKPKPIKLRPTKTTGTKSTVKIKGLPGTPGKLMTASGTVKFKGKTFTAESASVNYWKKSNKLFVTFFPFRLTNGEEQEILAGDKKEILYASKIAKRKPPKGFTTVPSFGITLDFKDGQDLTAKNLEKYSFGFYSFEKQGTNSGTGDWVMKKSKLKGLKISKAEVGGVVTLTVTGKAPSPHDWKIHLKTTTRISKVNEKF